MALRRRDNAPHKQRCCARMSWANTYACTTAAPRCLRPSAPSDSVQRCGPKHTLANLCGLCLQQQQHTGSSVSHSASEDGDLDRQIAGGAVFLPLFVLAARLKLNVNPATCADLYTQINVQGQCVSSDFTIMSSLSSTAASTSLGSSESPPLSPSADPWDSPSSSVDSPSVNSYQSEPLLEDDQVYIPPHSIWEEVYDAGLYLGLPEPMTPRREGSTKNVTQMGC
ncbi:hypothetical protein OH76DRAFT_839058 [Lentinus brumalis]|uniref:Uncharacterized protein n=1 Tax=Lentinus brumalis TaxID=2498619 RepID=A0A371D1K5_9APHY|nr:hypothetical protein OH76DRAFT_839058 [Polyporus brumalis]